MEFTKEQLDSYAEQHTTPEDPLLQTLAEYTRTNIPGAQMLCGRVEGQFLKWLVRLAKAKRILELGTYTGYSALSMAEALPDDGLVITCDKNTAVLTIAREYCEKSVHGKKIHIIEDNIMHLLDKLLAEEAKFDLIFVDADKKPNAEYIEKCLKMLNPKGFIAVDNTFFKGMVLHPQDETIRAIAGLNEALLKRNDLDVLFLPIRDGITLISKK